MAAQPQRQIAQQQQRTMILPAATAAASGAANMPRAAKLRAATAPVTAHTAAGRRHLSATAPARSEYESPFGVNSLVKLTEEEEMLQEAVRRFAEDVVQPKVEAMDENEKMDPEVIKGLFEQGLMGIETSEEHGGAGGSFTAAIIVIEGECAQRAEEEWSRSFAC